MLVALVLAATGSGDFAGLPSLQRRAAYYQSIVECGELGFDGVLVSMTDEFVQEQEAEVQEQAAVGQGYVRDRIQAALASDSLDGSDTFGNASGIRHY